SWFNGSNANILYSTFALVAENTCGPVAITMMRAKSGTALLLIRSSTFSLSQDVPPAWKKHARWKPEPWKKKTLARAKAPVSRRSPKQEDRFFVPAARRLASVPNKYRRWF